MADGGTWGGVSVVSAAVSAGTTALAYIAGRWTRNRQDGRAEGSRDAEVADLKQRIARLEKVTDDLIGRLGMVGERIAQMPTREEMAASFARLEGRLDALVFRREG